MARPDPYTEDDLLEIDNSAATMCSLIGSSKQPNSMD
jgi:hypothetical protein